MNDYIWRIRYALIAKRWFGWRTAWAFSLSWCDGELDRDGYSPLDAVEEDLRASL